jgi:hypothetical protein
MGARSEKRGPIAVEIGYRGQNGKIAHKKKRLKPVENESYT